MSEPLTYSYNSNQPEREIFFNEMCPCKDMEETNSKNAKVFFVSKHYLLDNNKGNIKIKSTVRRSLYQSPQFESTTNLILTDFENGSVEFSNPSVFYEETKKCFRGIYNRKFQLLGIGISKDFLGKQFIIDVDMFESGLRTYKITENNAS